MGGAGAELPMSFFAVCPWWLQLKVNETEGEVRMKIKKVVCYLSSFALIVALTACDRDQQVSTPAAAPANQAVAQSPANTAQNSTALQGKVVETQDAGGYTYLRIDNGSKDGLWAAIPMTQLNPGEMVTLQGGSEMRNFSSKTLDKTFESIIFADRIVRNDGNMGGAPAAAVAASTSGGKTGNVVAFENLKIKKADAANAQTVGDVFKQATALDKQKVTVKGKVVKVSRNIMGKNWLHLQDGTGDPGKNTHDLVITTAEIVEKGAIVTIEGTLAANKDFGSGYKYEVIMEGAKVVAR